MPYKKSYKKKAVPVTKAVKAYVKKEMKKEINAAAELKQVEFQDGGTLIEYVNTGSLIDLGCPIQGATTSERNGEVIRYKHFDMKFNMFSTGTPSPVLTRTILLLDTQNNYSKTTLGDIFVNISATGAPMWQYNCNTVQKPHGVGKRYKILYDKIMPINPYNTGEPRKAYQHIRHTYPGIGLKATLSGGATEGTYVDCEDNHHYLITIGDVSANIDEANLDYSYTFYDV